MAIFSGLNNNTMNVYNFFPTTKLKCKFVGNLWLTESKTRNNVNSTLSFTRSEMQKIMFKLGKKTD